MSEQFFDVTIRNELLDLMSSDDLEGNGSRAAHTFEEMLPALEQSFSAADWTSGV